jgi:hypothetical protein
MNRVFVSHASIDKRMTKSICAALNAEGISTWVSFCDIPSGANWDESIESALTQDIRQTHRLAPKKLFRSELWQWKADFRVYTFFKINVIIGRRHHYQGTARAAWLKIVSKINADMFSPKDCLLGGGFEIMSYDRILGAIAPS